MIDPAGFIHLSSGKGRAYLIAACLCPFLGYILGRAFAPFLPDTLISVLLLSGGLELLMIGLPAVLLIVRKPDAYKGMLDRPALYESGVVTLAAVSFALAAAFVTVIWLALLDLAGFTIPVSAQIPPAMNMGELLVALLTVALLPALCEELLFRGVFLQFLKRKLGGVLAVIVCALGFAALHFSVNSFAAMLVFGLFQSWLMLRYGKLWLVVLFHFLYNALVIVLQAMGTTPSAQTLFLCTGIFIATAYILFHRREGTLWS